MKEWSNGLEDLILLRWQYFPYWSRFKAIPIKIQAFFFAEIDKQILKFMQKFKKPRKATLILKMMSKVGGLTFWFQNLLPSYSSQNRVLLAQGIHINRGNRTDSPEIKTNIYGNLIFNKWTKERTVFSKKQCWDNWITMCKRMNLYSIH